MASDPGWLRARRAAQAALSASSTALILWLIQQHFGVPIRSTASGVMVSLFGIILVRETGVAQHATTAAIFLFSCLSATAAAALAPWWHVQAAAFLLVIFAAVYARRFGPRWGATGMAAYVTYLMLCLVKTPLRDLPYQWLGLAIGAAISDLWRAGLLRENAGRVLVGIGRALEVQIGLVLAELQSPVLREALSTRRRRRILRSRNMVVQDYALIEQQLEALGVEDSAGAWRLRRTAFELELATGGVARLVLSGQAKPELRQQIARLKRAFLRHKQPRPVGLAEDEEWDPALMRLASAPPLVPVAREVCHEHAASKRPIVSAPAASPTAAAPEPEKGLSTAMRQAIQTITACGLAMLGGMTLSPQRWEWAVIAAYVVFAGVRSSGHVLKKGLQRSLGTVAGVAIGIGLATLVGAHAAIAVPMLIVLVFLSFYSFQASYTAMIFWLTLALVLVYGLMGYFSPALLVLRLEETLIGSAAGTAVALLLFRSSTRSHVRTATRSFLDALRALVASVARGADSRSRLRRFRDLTLALQAVRDATRPNAGSWGRPAGTSVDFLEALWACRYFAGRLAMHEDFALWQPDTGSVSRIDRAIDGLCARLSRGASPATASATAHLYLDDSAPGEDGLPGLAHALDALDAALKDQARGGQRRLGRRRRVAPQCAAGASGQKWAMRGMPQAMTSRERGRPSRQ